MKKIRVYELARELNIESRDLVDKIKSMGITVSSYQSVLNADQLAKIRKSLGTPPEAPVKKRVVIKRRKKADQVPAAESISAAEAAATSESAAGSHEGTSAASASSGQDFSTSSGDGSSVAAGEAGEDGGEPVAAAAGEQTEVAADDSAPPTGATAAASATGEAEQSQGVGGDVKTPARAPGSRFSKVAQTLAQQREREGRRSPRMGEAGTFNAAQIVSKARAGQAVDQAVVPSRSAAPPRFSAPQSTAQAGSGEVSDEDVLKRRAIKKSKRPQFNPRDLLWSVDQEDSFVRHTRKKTVYAPMGTKNRDHRRRKGLKKTQITTPKASIRVVQMEESTLSVGELARQLSMKAAELIAHLMKDGIMATVNERLDIDTVTIVASQFDYEVKTVFKTPQEILARPAADPQYDAVRPPIVTLMGHVDHGKTSLLDAIRQGSVCATEDGGITQHIGAYMVTYKREKITFLDTPGHAAFSSIRGRGVKVTDIVVLVVAADDGVMPQTEEAIAHAKNADVPIIVALNKMDRPAKNLDRIYTQLAEHGIQAEEWGGEHQFVKLSALEKSGIDELLAAITLQAELLELKANTATRPRGVIIEAHMDLGRGPVATIMVSEGVFRVGDEIVAGMSLGRIRAMKDEGGVNVKAASPSMPVEIEGLNGLPTVGDRVDQVTDREQAKAVVAARRQEAAVQARGTTTISTLEELIAKVDQVKILSVPFIVKADTQGSMLAISEALADIKSDKVKAKLVHQGVGAINASDVALAQASGAVIMGFNVRLIRDLRNVDHLGVAVQYFSVIYELIDAAEALLAGSLPPIQNEVVIGRAEVRKLISVPKVGVVAGSAVSDGKIARHCKLRLIRDDVVIYDGALGSLRRFKDDVKEVAAGFECGISFDSYKDLKEGDVIEAYEIEELEATL